MRALSIALLAVVGLVVTPMLVGAEAGQPKVLKGGKGAGGKAAPPAPVESAELAMPGAAYRKMTADVRKERNYAKRRDMQKAAATAYLAKWNAAGKQAAGEDMHFLGLFQQILGLLI